jgi:hypothetical protein
MAGQPNKTFSDYLSDEKINEVLSLIDAPDWKLAKEAPDGSKVFVRQVPSSSLNAVKVTTSCKCSTTPLIDLLHTKMVERYSPVYVFGIPHFLKDTRNGTIHISEVHILRDLMMIEIYNCGNINYQHSSPIEIF